MIKIFPLHHDIYLISNFLCLNPYNLPRFYLALMVSFNSCFNMWNQQLPCNTLKPMAAYGLTGTQCGPLSPHVQQLLGPSRRGSTCGTILGSKARGTPIPRWFIMDSATKKWMIWVVPSFQEISVSDNRITILGKDGIPTTYGYIYTVYYIAIVFKHVSESNLNLFPKFW